MAFYHGAVEQLDDCYSFEFNKAYLCCQLLGTGKTLKGQQSVLLFILLIQRATDEHNYYTKGVDSENKTTSSFYLCKMERKYHCKFILLKKIDKSHELTSNLNIPQPEFRAIIRSTGNNILAVRTPGYIIYTIGMIIKGSLVSHSTRFLKKQKIICIASFFFSHLFHF